MTIWNIEHTDTFGGEANYSWVRRATIEMPEGASQSQIVRAAKAAIGTNGVRSITDYYNGDTYQIDYHGACWRTFITAEY